MCVLVLDRPRHKDIIQQCRAAGARIRLISDGDVGGAIQVAKAGTPVDMLVGIGGTPEGGLSCYHTKAAGPGVNCLLSPCCTRRPG